MMFVTWRGVLNGRVIVNVELKRMWNQNTFLAKTETDLNEDSQSLSSDLNPEPPKQKGEMLITTM